VNVAITGGPRVADAPAHVGTVVGPLRRLASGAHREHELAPRREPHAALRDDAAVLDLDGPGEKARKAQLGRAGDRQREVGRARGLDHHVERLAEPVRVARHREPARRHLHPADAEQLEPPRVGLEQRARHGAVGAHAAERREPLAGTSGS
jgi:hypothetical protein